MSSRFLDVEDDDQRHQRIGNILERLDTSPPLGSTAPRLKLPAEPPAALLARVRDFLPAISASNEALSRKRREDIDIEHIADDEHQYIEMNLGLGVFEAKRRRPHLNINTDLESPSASSDEDSASDRATDNDSSSYASESDSDSGSYDSEQESDEYSSSDYGSGSESGSAASVGIKHISSRPIKPLPRRALSQQVQQLQV